MSEAESRTPSPVGMPGFRLLMVVQKYPFPVLGGLERQAHELAKALIERGHAVRALSTRFDPRQEGVKRVDQVVVHRLNCVGPKPARFLMLSCSLARNLVRLRRHVDLVHVHSISSFGAFATHFSKAIGLPVVTKLPGAGEFGIPGVRRGLLGPLRVASLRRSDVVVAMAPESAEELSGIGYPAGRVLKVTNGVPVLARKPCRPGSSSAVNVVFVGRFTEEKGLRELLYAWRAVKTHLTRPARLRLIGDGPQMNELKALVRGFALGQTVEFPGYCADVGAELAMGDVFVLPSHSEGNSNAILEAMSAGLPVVSTRLGSTLIQVGREGERFLVPPGDHTALAARLIDLIEDEAERIRLGAAMHARVTTHFAIDLIAAIYERAYGLIVSGRRDEVCQLNPTLFTERSARAPRCAG